MPSKGVGRERDSRRGEGTREKEGKEKEKREGRREESRQEGRKKEGKRMRKENIPQTVSSECPPSKTEGAGQAR